MERMLLSVAACAVCLISITTFAQSADTRPRRVFAYMTDEVKPRKILSPNSGADFNAPMASKPRQAPNKRAEIAYVVEDVKPRKVEGTNNPATLARFHQLIAAAIDERLGAPYQWAGTGPESFDCSGFVWDTFRSAGIDFPRASAATLWEQFEAPAQQQEYKFGTLVFFSGQTHVGIVANERGFYHASRHKGVVYEEFSDYWISRIDGFRLVPVTAQQRPQRN